VFNKRRLFDGRKIRLKEIIDREANTFRYLVLEPFIRRGRGEWSSHPVLLRFPLFLLRFKKFVSKEYCVKNPCLYLDRRGRLYVRIKDTLFLVRFGRNVSFNSQRALKCMRLIPIRGHRLSKLIQKGLFGVLFEGGRR
jgi:hypothetical protein